MTVKKRFASRIVALTGLAAVLIVLCGTVVSCGGGSPEKVVARFAIAIMDKDMDKAKRCCTERFANVSLAGKDTELSMTPDYKVSNDEKPKVSDLMAELESSIDGDTAKVWSSDAEFVKYVLVKEKGVWKIDGVDIDYSAMTEMMKDMGMGF